MVRGTYRIGDARVGIRSTSKSFGVWLDEALVEYRRQRREEPSYSIVVGGPNERPGRTEMHLLYRGATAIVRTRSLPTLKRAVLAELESLLYPTRDDAAYLHASVIGVGGATALVPWWVAPEIARLGGRAERAGIALPGELAVALDPKSGEVVPASRTLRVPRKILRELEGPEAGERMFVTHPTTVDAVFAYREGEEMLGPVTKGFVLHQLGSAAANLPLAGPSVLEGMRRLLAGARVFGLGFGKPQAMLEAMTSAILGEPGSSPTQSTVSKIRAVAHERRGAVSIDSRPQREAP